MEPFLLTSDLLVIVVWYLIWYSRCESPEARQTEGPGEFFTTVIGTSLSLHLPNRWVLVTTIRCTTHSRNMC